FPPAGSSCEARRVAPRTASAHRVLRASSAPRTPLAPRRRPHRDWRSRRRPPPPDASAGWLRAQRAAPGIPCTDQLLETIRDVEVAVGVGVTDVAGMQPAVVVQDLDRKRVV